MYETSYNEIFKRNIGIIKKDEQLKLKKSSIAVFGLGGLGGVICEIIARSGIENFTIIDKDVFDPSNINRQIYANSDSIGKLKIDITENKLKKINANVSINKYLKINEENINEILLNIDIALLALDETIPCIIISRHAKKLNIPLIEGWALPYGNIRVFTKDTPSLEEVYNLPTINKDISNLSEEEKTNLNFQMLMELRKIPGIEQYYTSEALDRVKQRLIPSFAPMVWFVACLMAFETVKILLKKGNIALSPEFVMFDPFLFNSKKI